MKTIFVLAISFCFAASASAESPAPTFGLGDQCETGQCVVATNSSFGLVDRVRTRTRTVVRRAPVAQCVEVQAAPVYVEQLVPVTTMVPTLVPVNQCQQATGCQQARRFQLFQRIRIIDRFRQRRQTGC